MMLLKLNSLKPKLGSISSVNREPILQLADKLIQILESDVLTDDAMEQLLCCNWQFEKRLHQLLEIARIEQEIEEHSVQRLKIAA